MEKFNHRVFISSQLPNWINHIKNLKKRKKENHLFIYIKKRNLEAKEKKKFKVKFNNWVTTLTNMK